MGRAWRAVTPLACIVAIGLAIPAARADDAGFDRFDGAWSGGGSVQESARGQRLTVTCSMAGSHEATHLVLQGSCRALLLFTRKIGADIRYDPATKVYSGTYIGARVGPAKLVGKNAGGDTVRFDVTWPKPIDGDTAAEMVIRNAGTGQYSIEILDAPSPGAAPVRTVAITMTH